MANSLRAVNEPAHVPHHRSQGVSATSPMGKGSMTTPGGCADSPATETCTCAWRRRSQTTGDTNGLAHFDCVYIIERAHHRELTDGRRQKARQLPAAAVRPRIDGAGEPSVKSLHA